MGFRRQHSTDMGGGGERPLVGAAEETADAEQVDCMCSPAFEAEGAELGQVQMQITEHSV